MKAEKVQFYLSEQINIMCLIYKMFQVFFWW